MGATSFTVPSFIRALAVLVATAVVCYEIGHHVLSHNAQPPVSVASDVPGIMLQVPDLRSFEGQLPCRSDGGRRIDQNPVLVRAVQTLLGPQWSGFNEYLSDTTCTAEGIQQYGDYVVIEAFRPHVGPNGAMQFLDARHNELYVFWLNPFMDIGKDIADEFIGVHVPPAGIGILFASSPPPQAVLEKIRDGWDQDSWTMSETSRSTQNGFTWIVYSFAEKSETPAKAAWMKTVSASDHDKLKGIWTEYVDGVVRSVSVQKALSPACTERVSKQLKDLYGADRWKHVTDLIFEDISAKADSAVLNRWIQVQNIVYGTIEGSPERIKRLSQVYQTQDSEGMDVLLRQDYGTIAQAYTNAENRLEVRVAQEAGTLANVIGCR